MTYSTSWFGPGRNASRPPPNDFERAADYLEWVFHLPPGVVTQNVCARSLVNALQDVVTASFAQVGNPLEVKLGWQVVMDIMGPELFAAFINMHAWEDFCPAVSSKYNTPSRHVLWVGHGKRVVLRVLFRADRPTELQLAVEDIE
jgi:hypothetical protein